MITNLVDIEDAKGRLASGEQPYAYEVSNHTTMLGPACKYGAHYLEQLRTQGRYAETFAEASQIADETGVTITGVWFVKG